MSSVLTVVSGSVFCDAALKSAIAVLLAAVVASVLGRASAAWRHLVWCLSVASLLLLPVVSLVLPDWRVAWLPQWTAAPPQRAATGHTEFAQPNRNDNNHSRPPRPNRQSRNLQRQRRSYQPSTSSRWK